MYLAFSRDETLMGFAFPKEEREAALETYPDRFLRPTPSDMRYRWLVVRLDAIDKDDSRELAYGWGMVVPKKPASLSDDELPHLGVALGATLSYCGCEIGRAGADSPSKTRKGLLKDRRDQRRLRDLRRAQFSVQSSDAVVR